MNAAIEATILSRTAIAEYKGISYGQLLELDIGGKTIAVLDDKQLARAEDVGKSQTVALAALFGTLYFQQPGASKKSLEVIGKQRTQLYGQVLSVLITDNPGTTPPSRDVEFLLSLEEGTVDCHAVYWGAADDEHAVAANQLVEGLYVKVQPARIDLLAVQSRS